MSAWTTKRPTVPGWYWWRNDGAINGQRPAIVVDIQPKYSWTAKPLLVGGIRPGQFLLENASGEWQGPITPKD